MEKWSGRVGFWLGQLGLVSLGEWSVGQWIVGVMSFQKMHGLFGLSGDVTNAGQPERKDRATQLLICYGLSLAIICHIRQIPKEICF